MSGFVLVEERPTAGVRHSIGPGITIGREDCDITLADEEVSRRHARIRALDGSLAVEDTGSTNGTYVNGQRLSGLAELHEGDMLTLGNSALRVEAVREAGATQAPAAPQTTERPAEPVAPAPVTPAPQPVSPAPAAPAPEPVAAGGARGDVPAPAPASESQVHRTIAPVAQPPQHEFRPEPPARGRRGSAATRTEVTLISYGIVLATAGAIVAYVLAR